MQTGGPQGQGQISETVKSSELWHCVVLHTSAAFFGWESCGRHICHDAILKMNSEQSAMHPTPRLDSFCDGSMMNPYEPRKGLHGPCSRVLRFHVNDGFPQVGLKLSAVNESKTASMLVCVYNCNCLHVSMAHTMHVIVHLSLSHVNPGCTNTMKQRMNVYLRSTWPLLDGFDVGHRGTFCGLCFGCCHCRDFRPDESQRLRKGQRAGKTIKDCNAMNLRLNKSYRN